MFIDCPTRRLDLTSLPALAMIERAVRSGKTEVEFIRFRLRD
jgi:hypothetical protein